MTDPFHLLKLDRATATEDAVKASYAALLKKTRPEDDRDAFMALRRAFSDARAIAKGNDARRAAAPAAEPDAIPADDTQTAAPAPTPAPVVQPAIKWTFDKAIGWNIPDTSQGALIQKTLEWMVAGGPDPDSFVAHVADQFLTDATLKEPQFRQEIIDYIVTKADQDYQQDNVAEWEVFEIDPPKWLNHDVMRSLAQGLRLFKDRPSQSWAARNYNVALKVFAPVLEAQESATEGFAPIDAAAIFADEQDQQRKDDHGSFFDRESMAWQDMSPVGQAMRDIQAAIDQGLWNLHETIAQILARDELQVIDEFQMLDNRMRNLICSVTGWHSQDRTLVYPPWLTSKLVLLLDDTFGWSRHHGRPGWERQQFGWLHKVISRDRKFNSDQPSFRAAPAPQTAPARPAPKQPTALWAVMFFMFNKPLWILASYLGYRVLQTALRVMS